MGSINWLPRHMAFALLVECQRDISLIKCRTLYLFVALKSIFQMFDKDDDGKITIQEMKNTLRAMGEILTEEEIDEAFKSLDIDGQLISKKILKKNSNFRNISLKCIAFARAHYYRTGIVIHFIFKFNVAASGWYKCNLRKNQCLFCGQFLKTDC